MKIRIRDRTPRLMAMNLKVAGLSVWKIRLSETRGLRDSDPDMPVQSQLSCNLPLICPDYAICGCIIKGIRVAARYRVGVE
jgi:hypothetical protein